MILRCTERRKQWENNEEEMLHNLDHTEAWEWRHKSNIIYCTQRNTEQ